MKQSHDSQHPACATHERIGTTSIIMKSVFA